MCKLHNTTSKTWGWDSLENALCGSASTRVSCYIHILKSTAPWLRNVKCLLAFSQIPEHHSCCFVLLFFAFKKQPYTVCEGGFHGNSKPNVTRWRQHTSLHMLWLWWFSIRKWLNKHVHKKGGLNTAHCLESRWLFLWATCPKQEGTKLKTTHQHKMREQKVNLKTPGNMYSTQLNQHITHATS